MNKNKHVCFIVLLWESNSQVKNVCERVKLFFKDGINAYGKKIQPSKF